jgi:hypothetical protein
MRHDEFTNYLHFWSEKQGKRKGLYQGAKTHEDIMIKQLAILIDG